MISSEKIEAALSAHAQLNEEERILFGFALKYQKEPVKAGRGRPLGSRNKRVRKIAGAAEPPVVTQ